jgi:hypothetical protein
MHHVLRVNKYGVATSIDQYRLLPNTNVKGYYQ